MIIFPNILTNEYVVVFCDKDTGVIVDLSNKWFLEDITSNAPIYNVVSSRSEAVELIYEKLKKHLNLEGLIYNSKQEFVEVIDSLSAKT